MHKVTVILYSVDGDERFIEYIVGPFLSPEAAQSWYEEELMDDWPGKMEIQMIVRPDDWRDR